MGMTINRAVRIYRNRCGLFLAHANIAEQAANARADSKVLDFSDLALEKSASTKIGMELCSKGQFVAIRSKTRKF
jgi:hypothetical protein